MVILPLHRATVQIGPFRFFFINLPHAEKDISKIMASQLPVFGSLFNFLCGTTSFSLHDLFFRYHFG